jgi:hypothetical protein
VKIGSGPAAVSGDESQLRATDICISGRLVSRANREPEDLPGSNYIRKVRSGSRVTMSH